MSTTQQIDATGTEALLKELVCAIVSKPEELRVVSQWTKERDGCFFGIKGAPADDGILLGKQRSHFDALDAVMDRIGYAQRKTFTLAIRTTPMLDEPPRREFVQSFEHDPKKSAELLRRILVAMGISDFRIEVGPDSIARHGLSFVFTIHTTDYFAGILLRFFEDDPGESLVTVMGTLWRAIAMRQGVRYQINVETA